MSNFSVVKGNIVNMKVDAIVNATNTSLMGGDGIDGAIHRAAGAELISCCRKIGGCKTGEAVITPGFKLDAKYIIHTVGPVWNNGLTNEAELLRQCYIKCLDLAVEYNCRTVVFPSISTGANRFPLAKAAEIAINTIIEYLEQDTCLEDVKIVCFDFNTKAAYDKVMRDLGRLSDDEDLQPADLKNLMPPFKGGIFVPCGAH